MRVRYYWHEYCVVLFDNFGGVMFKFRKMKYIGTSLVILPLTACHSFLDEHAFSSEGSTANPSIKLNSSSKAERALRLLEQKAVAARAEEPIITGVGYATVSGQPSKDVNEKRLMAIRAARMGAYRDLAEQVHGMKVDAQTTVIDALVQNDSLRTKVSGSIRGAKTVRINPVGSDNYEVVLEIDRKTILDLVSASM